LEQLLDGATQPPSAKPPLPPQRYGHRSNVNPFDFIERDIIARAVVELRSLLTKMTSVTFGRHMPCSPRALCG
jgi:hypothetical protein